MNENQIKRIKELYTKGTRIKLEHMDDSLQPIPDGMLGTVDHVDDAGQIHMKWDNGRALAIVPEIDSFRIVDEEISKDMMTVLIIEPEKHPRIANIHNDLETMQDIVGGDIEMINLDDDTVLTCNEAGKLLHLEPNRSINGDVIVGTFFIARDDGTDQLQSLTSHQIEKYMNHFMEIESFMSEEMRIGGL